MHSLLFGIFNVLRDLSLTFLCLGLGKKGQA